MENSNINEMIRQSLDSIRSIAGAETIIGDPINTPAGVTIIPVSRVSVGFATGALDSAGRNSSAEDPKKSKTHGKSFGGGGGSGLSITPVAFLIVNPSGTVELLNISAPTAASNTVDSFGSILEKSPDILSRIVSIFKKDKGDEKEEKAEDLHNTEEADL